MTPGALSEQMRRRRGQHRRGGAAIFRRVGSSARLPIARRSRSVEWRLFCSNLQSFSVLIDANNNEANSVKLRIRDNSIRLRLMRAEVNSLRDEGLVTASTDFPGGRSFGYSVESSPASVNPAAFLSDGKIIVRLPEAAVLAWAGSEQVSIEGEQILTDGERLKVLVEKDFVCLTGRDDEDESDMFPHPEAGKASC